MRMMFREPLNNSSTTQRNLKRASARRRSPAIASPVGKSGNAAIARFRPALRVLAGLLLCLSILIPPASAEEITVAAATNFVEPLEALRRLFEKQSGHSVVISSGSSGQLYAQIVNGAPYDLFLSADDARPARLEEAGLAVAGTRFTYAVGRLALWQPDAGAIGGAEFLRAGAFRHLALANPRLAPYGLAARQTLESLGLWEPLRERLVLGENIGQTYSLIATGNAELGFVALSQLRRPGAETRGVLWVVPESRHEPILQQAVLIEEGVAARAFLDFLRSAPARGLISAYGYGLEGGAQGVPAARDPAESHATGGA